MAVILIVDDEPETRGVLQETLETAHHTVLAAQNGSEALQFMSAAQVDLVITDILMPETDGFGVLMELRRHHPHVKVMAYSGGYDFDVLRAAKALGAHATLPKPFAVAQLLRTVQHVLTGKA